MAKCRTDRRTRTWVCMQLASAGVGMCIATSPSVSAQPAQEVLAPGAAISIVGSETLLCTAGFVAHNQRGAPVMFTAGHCDNGGNVQMNSSRAGGLVPVADFVVSEFGGDRGEQADVAVMSLTGAAPLSSKIDGQLPVTASVMNVEPGMRLCKVGITTGHSCGPVVSTTGSKVKFAAKIAGGDSGGPVYVLREDGTAAAVGITIRNSSSDGYPVAELIGPWLQRWDLTIS